jgi:topoisomerase IA-like protein
MSTNTNPSEISQWAFLLLSHLEKVLLKDPNTSPTTLTITVNVADHNPNRMPEGVTSSCYLWMQSGSQMRLSLQADQEEYQQHLEQHLEQSPHFMGTHPSVNSLIQTALSYYNPFNLLRVDHRMALEKSRAIYKISLNSPGW